MLAIVYSETSKGYRVYNADTNTVKVVRDVYFTHERSLKSLEEPNEKEKDPNNKEKEEVIVYLTFDENKIAQVNDEGNYESDCEDSFSSIISNENTVIMSSDENLEETLVNNETVIENDPGLCDVPGEIFYRIVYVIDSRVHRTMLGVNLLRY